MDKSDQHIAGEDCSGAEVSTRCPFADLANLRSNSMVLHDESCRDWQSLWHTIVTEFRLVLLTVETIQTVSRPPAPVYFPGSP